MRFSQRPLILSIWVPEHLAAYFVLVKNYLPEFSRPLDIMGTMIDKGAVVGLLVFDEAISFNCFLKGRYLCSLLKGCSNKHGSRRIRKSCLWSKPGLRS